MDTGNYMANQMSDLIEQGEKLRDSFDNWLYEAVVIYCENRIDPHDVYPNIELTDAKLSFMSGMSPKEYSETIRF